MKGNYQFLMNMMVTSNEKMEEEMFLGLRKIEGVSHTIFKKI